MRQNVILFINEFLEREQAKQLFDENALFLESELDSLGYILLDAELQEKYKYGFLHLAEINYEAFTLGMLVDAVLHKENIRDESDYKIERLTQKDIFLVGKILSKELNYVGFSKHVKEHIRHCISYKMEENGEMKAFFMVKKFQKNYSLTHFYIDESIRKKKPAFFFFLFCIKKMQGLPIYIKANKNLKDYERYFKKTEKENIYLFEGLRKESEWAELLKR